jgi:2-polyprenyl-3-methyl-5-hydroxy-6-metoxy-1,4-benzoquinol methylase
MDSYLKTIATHLAKKFKQFPYLGRQRFWILYWAYKLTGWHIRADEWDFILKYLPKLMKGQNVKVLDVGCAKNLIQFELLDRLYLYIGIDLKLSRWQKYPYCMKHDITQSEVRDYFDFVTCISVLEHIGNNGKGDFADQKKAIENMCASLKIGGRLLLTTPTREFAQGHPWHGFSWADIASLLPKTMRSIESTERAGQLCMALERVA